MPAFCIDKCILGTEMHLASDGRGYAWVDHSPVEAWHLTGKPKLGSRRCLDTAFALAGRCIDAYPVESHRNAVELFGKTLDCVPWSWTMTPKAHKTFVRGLINQVVGAMANLDTVYYDGTWVMQNGVFAALQQARLDVARWQALCSEPGANVGVLDTFKPDKDGYCSNVIYDRLLTRTGRLTVAEGPHILTLNRRHRDMLVSEYGDDGQVVQLDFNALEVRGLYYEYENEEVVGDFYAALAAGLHKPVRREVAKKIVILALYGQSPTSLAASVCIELGELKSFMNNIRSQFGIDSQLQKLRRQNLELGGIKNHHGRLLQVPSTSDNILLNTFAQSTGVDVSLLGFSNVVNDLPASARPLFLIHDALVVDIKKSDVPLLNDLKHVKVDGYSQRFLLKIEPFSNVYTNDQ